MMRHIIQSAIVLGAVVGSPVSALAADDTWAARGPGIKSCEYWTAAFKHDEEAAAGLVDWLSGFMSGVNASRSLNSQNGKISTDMSIKDLLMWMNNYCAEHPSNAISSGAQVLMYSLIQRQGSAAAPIR
jgi:hypothetical protein